MKHTDINSYISAQSSETQQILQKLRDTIHAAVPDLKETIAYDMPSFTLNGTRIIYFAAWKNHIGLYPLYNTDDEIDAEFKKYPQVKHVKDAVHLPLSDQLPYEFVAKIAKYKARQYSQ